MLFLDYSGLHSEIKLHYFWKWEKEAGFNGEPTAPLLTRIVLSAPLLSEVTRIMFRIEKRRRLPCGVSCRMQCLNGTLNVIRYIYEYPYEIDTRTNEYGQYHPDFYLPDYKIYIEYFGIDR